jgi:hypothetical protein
MMTVNKSMFRVSRKGRDGFSVLELVLMLIIVGLVGVVGLMAYNARTKPLTAKVSPTPASQKQPVQSGTAEDVSDRFVDAMMKNDAGTAYLLTSPDYKALTSQLQTQTIFESINSKITKKPVKVSGQTPNQKKYHYTVQGEDGPRTLVIRMQSVGNKWLIYGFQLHEAQL